jgi:uncharacterized protein
MKKLIETSGFDRKQLHIYLILLSAPLLLTLYWYYGSARQFVVYFPSLAADPQFDVYSHVLQFAAFFILVMMIPLLYIKIGLKKRLIDFGFGLGDKKFGFIFVLTVIPLLVVPLIFIASQIPDVRSEYPLAKLLHSRHDLIFCYELFYVSFYYFAWEFYFRGFLLFGLKDTFGSMNAILIQTISSCLIHLGKPDSEIFGSIVAGILFGMIALRTRSFWYVFILHAAIGVLTDIFVLLI